MELKAISVSYLNNYIKNIFDLDPILNNICVEGEVSNISKNTRSKHVYFSLKDEDSRISCVIFESNFKDVLVDIEEGIKVKVYGRVSTYTKQGSYQIYINKLSGIGKGDLHQKFLDYKIDLEKKGYFSPLNKKSIPFYPRVIGLITSKDSAAAIDFLTVLKRRCDNIKVILYNSLVQGFKAKDSIKEGIDYFNNKNNVEAVVITRGGGSLEEMWTFNEPEVIESIYNSNIPIISAIGHERDFFISDYVADLRASTPSVAAEIIAPNKESLKLELNNINKLIISNIQNKITQNKDRLDNLNQSINLSKFIRIKDRKSKNLDEKIQLIKKYTTMNLKQELKSLEKTKLILKTNDPSKILDKGFYIIKNLDGKILKDNDLNEENRSLRLISSNKEFDISINHEKEKGDI